MEKNSLKVMTLNIHNYHDFLDRKPKIIALIKRYDPDIVALQEIRDNRAKNVEDMDQATQLNKKLGYEHSKFMVVNDRNKIKGLIDAPSCFEGLAILSIYPFSSEEILLKKHEDDKFFRKVLVANVQVSGQIVPVWVVHFSNNDLFASLHAEETFASAKATQPIIIGDFNIKHLEVLQKLAEENNYVSSSDFDYVSFPEDNCSYDYIFIPKKFSFLSFECIPEDVSDHKALFAKLKL